MQIIIGDALIHYEVHGEGRPLLMLHGWGGSIRAWAPTVQAVANLGVQVHAFDLPGFGLSPVPPQPWTVGSYAAMLAEYCGRKGISRAAVIGHSFGGRCGIVLAADHPQTVGRLVLVNSAGVRTEPGQGTQLLGRLGGLLKPLKDVPGLGGLYQKARRQVYRQIGAEDYLDAGPLRETFVKVIEEDLRPYAARITCPTLLIWGAEDDQTPVWEGETLREAIPNAQMTVLAEAGHFSYVDQPEGFLTAVKDFIQEQE